MRVSSLCIALAIAGQCHADDCAPRSLVETYSEDGRPKSTIPWQPHYMDAPSWNIEQGEPPLPVSAAIRKSLDWIEDKTGRTDVRVGSISLHLVGCADKWVYWIHFMPAAGSDTPEPGMVVVLMDGTVIGDRIPVTE